MMYLWLFGRANPFQHPVLIPISAAAIDSGMGTRRCGAIVIPHLDFEPNHSKY